MPVHNGGFYFDEVQTMAGAFVYATRVTDILEVAREACEQATAPSSRLNQMMPGTDMTARKFANNAFRVASGLLEGTDRG